MHSNKYIVPDSGTVDHGAMGDRHMVSYVDVRKPRMNNTVILNITIGSYSDRKCDVSLFLSEPSNIEYLAF